MKKDRLDQFQIFRITLIALFCLSTQLSISQVGMGNDPLESVATIQTEIDFRNSSQVTPLAFDFNADEWYYIAYTKPLNGAGAFYVNGEYVGDINWDNISYDHTILNIAASYYFDWDGYFSGTIDEIRITNQIKDVTELKAYYDANQSFSAEPATANIWKFDEGSGTEFFNEAGTLTGKLSGDPVWVDGKFGKAIKYDGVDDRGRLNVTLLSSFVTYELWVKFDGEIRGTSQTILQPFGGNGSSIDLQINQTLVEPPPAPREDVVFSMNSYSDVVKGSEILIPITVEKFVDILTFQQSLLWDPAVLQYQGVQDFALDDLDETSFNLAEAGKLALSWSPTDLQTRTVNDQTVLFNIVFSVVGDQGTMTDLVFSDDPTMREVSDGDANILDAIYEDGTVSIVDEVTLGGFIKTQSRDPVPGVEVTLAGGLDQTTTTDDTGYYNFVVIPNQDYTITPMFEAENGADDGVSTLDLVIMQWHILGMKYLMSNYDLIASDVNQSGNLTAMDVAQTRAVILHTDEMFGGRNSVELINYEYTGVPDAFSYQNYLDINPSGSQTDLDFTAVKIGDAGRNWSVTNEGGREKQLENIKIIIEQGGLADNKEIVQLKTREFDIMLGLQFTLEWDPAIYQFEGLSDQQLHFDANLNMLKEGKLTVVWSTDEINGLSLEDGSILSDLEFVRLTDVETQISITSEITPALAFNSNLETRSVKGVSILRKELSDDISVYPNPAQKVLNINMDIDSMPDYSIKNATGILIRTGRLQNDKEIDVEGLKKGIYILQLIDQNSKVVNKKFIKQ